MSILSSLESFRETLQATYGPGSGLSVVGVGPFQMAFPTPGPAGAPYRHARRNWWRRFARIAAREGGFLPATRRYAESGRWIPTEDESWLESLLWMPLNPVASFAQKHIDEMDLVGYLGILAGFGVGAYAWRTLGWKMWGIASGSVVIAGLASPLLPPTLEEFVGGFAEGWGYGTLFGVGQSFGQVIGGIAGGITGGGITPRGLPGAF